MKSSSDNIKELQPYLNHNSYHVFFTNLANPLKIGIILSLRTKDKSVTQISKELLVEQSKISHALKTLKNCSIVDVKQKGKQRIYSLNKKTIVPILDIIEKHARIYCGCKCCTKENCPGRKK
jgi:DNA-binding transcriptional ArsR family regulator